jgi:SSS family solute:Na+ symporter
MAGLITGTFMTVFLYLFIHKAEAVPLGICKMLSGRDFLITQMPWPVVDPIIIALPLAILVTVAVSLGTKKMDEKHLEECFKGLK